MHFILIYHYINNVFATFFSIQISQVTNISAGSVSVSVDIGNSVLVIGLRKSIPFVCDSLLICPKIVLK